MNTREAGDRTRSERIAAARSFMAGNGRVLDRRRFELFFDGAGAEPVLAALRAYRNADGGFGHGLEPDLRAPESQPAAAWHAFEVFADVAPVTAPEAAELCDWLDSVALPGGGLPFALPIKDPSGCVPFWAQADPHAFSLQITALVAAHANRVAVHDPAVAGHPWLARATSCCLAAIEALEAAPEAYVLAFALQLLDAVHDRDGRAPRNGQVRCRNNRWDIYKVIDSHTLTISKGGTGAGSVESNPAGIACGTDCQAVFHGGTTVTLTATPDAGSVFSGWSDPSCATNASCPVTVETDISLTATFDLSP